MAKKLFTERHGGAKPRVAEELDAPTRDALLNLVTSRIEEDWFGKAFPEEQFEGYGSAGTNREKLRRTMAGFGLLWPPDLTYGERTGEAALNITDGEIFDVLEYSYEAVAKPHNPSYEQNVGRTVCSYRKQEGQALFAEDVNRLFERNGMAFELREGEIVRFGPAVLQEALAAAVFNTGDAHLDEMLEDARTKILHRALKMRRESLKELWDAWERLKTLENPDKKKGIAALLDRAAAQPALRKLLEDEANALSKAGNDFMIRHTETTKVPVSDSAHIDYLFHRMFALIRLLLKASGRGG